jgi:aldehyde:ferredoxin oxidoreductase
MEYLSANKIVIVDLTTGEVDEEELYEDLIMELIGGVGVTNHLYKRFKDDNPIVFGTGLLTGTLVPGSSLGIITAKTPHSGKVCHAPFCLYAGMEMKYAGFDYLVVKGISETPVYLWLHDGIVDINSADEIMHMTPWEIVDIKKGLRAKLGDELIQFLQVGKAAEDGSDIAQVLLNCWSSGDRWGFGKIMGDKKLKGIAMRGMGLLEVADVKVFVDNCIDLISSAKNGTALAHKGCIEFPAALGEEDISNWINPFVHKHSSNFNCPYPSNTFVKYNEDSKILKETDVEEPGVMITDIYGLIGFKKMGLSAEDSCRMIEACNKYGVDPVAAAELLEKTGKTDIESLKKEIPNLKGPVESVGASKFSPWCPPKPLFADFGDIDKDSGWWERRQAVAYIFGIDPIFAIMAPELTEEKLIELVNIGTGLEITSETLNKVVTELLS